MGFNNTHIVMSILREDDSFEKSLISEFSFYTVEPSNQQRSRPMLLVLSNVPVAYKKSYLIDNERFIHVFEMSLIKMSTFFQTS